ncbi:MAG: flagellar biosynthesis regulator FlaF [Paracoccaceae bacterium]
MNAIELARSAYASTRTTARTDRSTEYHVFARITRDMTIAGKRGKTGFPALARALHENRKLWQIIASDVAHPENKLPEQLRARLFYLAEFTLQHSRQVLAGEQTVDALIDINTNVMRGLKGVRGETS